MDKKENMSKDNILPFPLLLRRELKNELILDSKKFFNLVKIIIDYLSIDVLSLTQASKIVSVDTPTNPPLNILSEFNKISIHSKSQVPKNINNSDFTFITQINTHKSNFPFLVKVLSESKKSCCLLSTHILCSKHVAYREKLAKENIFIDSILILPKNSFTSLELCLVFFDRKKKNEELVMQVEDDESLEFQLQEMENRIFDECRSVEFQDSITNDELEFYSDVNYDEYKDYYTIECEEKNIPRRRFSNREAAVKFIKEKKITHYKIHKENDYENLWEGQYFAVGAFKTIEHYEVQKHINSLTTEYKNYKRYTLGEISKNINSVKKNSSGFPKFDNSIYFPNIGNKKISVERGNLKLKDQNIFQVVLNPDIITNEYAAIFINSNLGQKYIKLLYSEKGVIPKLSKIDIDNFPMLVPDIKSQSQICETDRQIKGTLEVLKKLQVDLQQEPLNEKSIERVKLISESALSALETEIIAKDLRRSENKNVEFKQTLSWDTRTGKKNPALELEVIKNICAFANVEGGRLYIGVHDNGEALGTDEELKKLYGNSQDKFKLKLTDLLKESIVGNDYIELLDYRFSTEYNNIPLFIITVKKGKAIWHKNGNLYVRENPRTRGLIGKEASDYANSRQ